MKYITQYNIFESRGYMSELEDAADDILEESKKSRKFTLPVQTNRGNFFINVVILSEEEYRKSQGKGDASCQTISGGISTLYLKDNYINKSTIIHELKHAFSHLYGSKKKMKMNYFINHLQQSIGDSYDSFFKISPKYFSTILYFLNKEELEAYYHGMWYDIKDNVKDMNSSEKKKYIDDYLDNNLLFLTLKRFKDGDFKFESLFKSKNQMNLFFDWYSYKISDKSDSLLMKIRDNLKIILAKYRYNTKNDYTKSVNEINNEINSNCKKYYKKYLRLYTI